MSRIKRGVLKAVSKMERLSKGTIALIAFFFGVGMFCFAGAVGAAIPFAIRLALRHPRVVLECLMALGLLPVFWLLGRPVARILERR